MEYITVTDTSGNVYEIGLTPQEKQRFLIGKVILLSIFSFVSKLFIENCTINT